MCIGGTSQFPLTLFRGIDQWGERFGYLLLDPMVGAIGAFSFRRRHRDRRPGRAARSAASANVEHNEQSFPLLVLYRKENIDSGGAGQWRGGPVGRDLLHAARDRRTSRTTRSRRAPRSRPRPGWWAAIRPT